MNSIVTLFSKTLTLVRLSQTVTNLDPLKVCHTLASGPVARQVLAPVLREVQIERGGVHYSIISTSSTL